MTEYTHETFISSFTWRYGSDEMRRLWSEVHKRRLWRRIWVALATVQAEAGLVSPEQVADLAAHQDEVDWERAQEIEAELRHDLMAEVRAFAEQCPVGGGIIHLGATSMDVEDNADALRLRDSLRLVRQRLVAVLQALSERIEQEADTVMMAYTHLQPAEPTTLGYRLAQYAQDFLEDLRSLDAVLLVVRGKGFKGAVGTSASYAHLLEGSALSPQQMEERAMARLGLAAYPVTTQTYPRKLDFQALSVLAGIAQSAYKFALDLRLLQSPVFGELAEPFGKSQVGSSAMPFKRNPITSESICSLARYVAELPRAAWDNAAHSALERTLDDSANRRVVLPEGFLAVDDILIRLERVIRGLRVGREAIQAKLETYGPFAATEPLLMALAKAGADRQEMHERIRQASMTAWAAIQRGEANPLADLLAVDPRVLSYLDAARVRGVLEQGAGVGDAPARCRALAQRIRLEVAGESMTKKGDGNMTVFGRKLAEGKTKIIYAHPDDPKLIYMVHKDGLSAGDGARRNTLPGKGKVACRTTSNVYALLEWEGVTTHYLDRVEENVNLVKACTMIPLEVVMRRIATGSYIRRNPEVAEGTRFDPVLVEIFLKDDALHDPLIGDDEIVARGIATQADVDHMRETGRRVFDILERAWAKLDVTLVDCKIEFGRTKGDGQLVVADVIDNDSWRIWPAGDKSRMLDKQIYRNMPEVTDERLAALLAKYVQVADLTDAFLKAG